MNGTWRNWLAHAALALVIVTLVWLIFGSTPVAATVATVWFWAKEAGEKSKDWSAPRRPWSDLNPFDSRWSRDDRMDLLVPAATAWILAGVFA